MYSVQQHGRESWWGLRNEATLVTCQRKSPEPPERSVLPPRLETQCSFNSTTSCFLYFNNALLAVVEETWESRGIGRVFSEPQNPAFKAVYIQSRSFYVEHLSTVEAEPYWSNTLYLVVPKEFWSYYTKPELRSEHFLMPRFGCGFSLVSPEFPHLHSSLPEQNYDGLTILISSALEAELKTHAGKAWTFPPQVRVHGGLHHAHDMVVVDGNSKVVAPLYQTNPILREYL